MKSEFNGLNSYRQCEKVGGQVLTDVMGMVAHGPCNVRTQNYNVTALLWAIIFDQGPHQEEDRMQKKRTNMWAASLLAAALTIAWSNVAAAKPKPTEAGSMPKVGDMAPDFTLHYFDGKDLKSVSLSQYRGKKNVVLGFFIFAFTGG
jgi:hypothetical protein